MVTPIEAGRADVRWGSVPRLFADAAFRFGDAEAIVDGDVRLSWNDVASNARRAAKAYLAVGITKGDRVAIWAPNCHEWVAALVGLHSVGAVLVPLNTRYKGAEAAWILQRSGAVALVTVDGFLGNGYVGMLQGARDAAGGLPTLREIVVLRDDAPEGTRGWDDFLAAGDVIDDAVLDARIAEVGADDLSDMMFTSGTTGRPKGVLTAHGQMLRCVQGWVAATGLDRDDRYLIVNPFFHSFGYKAGIIACAIAGATMLPLATFDVPVMMELIEAEKVSTLPGAPTIYQTMLNRPDRVDHDLSSLRLAVTGAAVIPVSLVEDMKSVLGFDTVVTAYGLTEACGFATICHHDDPAELIATTSGKAMAGMEVLIFDGDNHEVPRGEPGEVVVRGYNVMQGYFEDPDETAKAIDDRGWLHTGDIGVMDENGYLKITDRVKDMFICGGFNAYPAEIESLLLAHPGIAQVAVVGVPDERMGEVGAAFVVPAAGATVDPDEIVAWAKREMANYKAPATVHVVDALPTNASGKILKFELRDRLLGG
ncbi:MAG: AMP-binding protein [Actinobacteria bacterium]|nr:AMP-binding protein [Actinomycetota bacterium]